MQYFRSPNGGPVRMKRENSPCNDLQEILRRRYLAMQSPDSRNSSVNLTLDDSFWDYAKMPASQVVDRIYVLIDTNGKETLIFENWNAFVLPIHSKRLFYWQVIWTTIN